ncbi:MAG TPA: hypothetical protein PKO06_10720 [Candidatus Ozemobacteraceae bacterium]|nr:hypothetical protein [Candidatus Ozemobacteraceae bacterium]
MQLYIQIVETFLDQPAGVLSIHQIAQRLELPYGTAYNRTHQLGGMGVLRIQPQGKAKLCSLNAANPMTGNLLALGAAQRAHQFMMSGSPLADVISKVRSLIEASSGDLLQSALILNLDHLKEIEIPVINWENSSIDGQASTEPEVTLPLDLFLITDEKQELETLQQRIESLAPPGLSIKPTRMQVCPTNLIEMLRAEENDAGIAAYQILRRALPILGFERFFSIILRAFPAH